MEEIEYPIRINRYLFLKGHCSRREADRLIEKKQIRINGKMALIGQRVEKGDKVEISKEVEKIAQNRVYLAFNKPRGIVTHDPVEGQTSISDILCKECTKLSAVREGEENFSEPENNFIDQPVEESFAEPENNFNENLNNLNNNFDKYDDLEIREEIAKEGSMKNIFGKPYSDDF